MALQRTYHMEKAYHFRLIGGGKSAVAMLMNTLQTSKSKSSSLTKVKSMMIPPKKIWIGSLSAGAGYWGMEGLSMKTFVNELLTEPGQMYMRTGYLGRIIDGKLFITGRIKDLTIVAGRNIYSTDAEKTIEKTSDILQPGCCAVVGITDEVLMSKGISFPKGSDQLGLVVVAEEHGISIASIVAIKPRSISKTTSGKIRRFEVAKRFTDGTVSVVEYATNREKSSWESKDYSTPQITRNLAPGNDKISKGTKSPSLRVWCLMVLTQLALFDQLRKFQPFSESQLEQ